MDDLLTTRQLQELLKLDRVTIYRMLASGRLQGFKVGGQWRFSRHEIENWLQVRQVPAASKPAPEAPAPTSSTQALPLSCVRAIQELAAEATDVATVTTDPQGIPLVEVSHSCPFCTLIRSTQEGRRRCSRSWLSGGDGQMTTCHAGLLCTSVPIVVDRQQVGLAAACQFQTEASRSAVRPEKGPLPHILTLAKDLGLSSGELQSASAHVWILASDQLPRVVALVRRMASTFSEIGQERLGLINRLQVISEMSQLQTN